MNHGDIDKLLLEAKELDPYREYGASDKRTEGEALSRWSSISDKTDTFSVDMSTQT